MNGFESPEVRRITIIDSSLRDGEQAPGVAYSLEEKLRLVMALREAGIDEIELGVPMEGNSVAELVRKLRSPGYVSLVFCRARMEDLRAAADCGASRVHISFPVSERLLNSVNMSCPDIEERITRMGAFCGDHFEFFSAGLFDASRTEASQCLDFARWTADAGFMRLRYADTLGVMFPWDVETAVEHLLAAGLPLEFHAHNDLGLAGANALAAVRAGASAVSGTVLGMGERAGNLALEEFVVALGLSGLGVSGIRYEFLGTLCRLASELSGRDIPPDKPVAGSAVYSHESGIHAAAVLRDPECFQSFDPVRLGFRRGKTVFGATSGRHALAACLASREIYLDGAEIVRFLCWLQDKARVDKCSFDCEIMESLYEEFQQQI
jgi:homocitrate synthase NifV